MLMIRRHLYPYRQYADSRTWRHISRARPGRIVRIRAGALRIVRAQSRKRRVRLAVRAPSGKLLRGSTQEFGTHARQSKHGHGDEGSTMIEVADEHAGQDQFSDIEGERLFEQVRPRSARESALGRAAAATR